MKPLFYLLFCRLRNSLRQATKQPRLLLPGTLIVISIAFQLSAFFLASERGNAGATALLTGNDLLTGQPGAFLLVVRGMFLVSVLTAFVTALGEGNVFFDRSDVDYLFPAPLPRRGVLLFKMLGKYVALLFPAAYLPVAFAGAYLVGMPVSVTGFLPGILGGWLFLIAVANVTQISVLNRPALDEAMTQRREQWRKGMRLFLVVLIVGGMLTALARETSHAMFVYLTAWVNSPGISHALLPDAWAADLFHLIFEPWRPEDSWRLGGLVALAVLSFWGLFAHERDFYENALELSVRRSRIVQALNSGDAGAVLSQMAQEGKLARGHSLRDFGSGARAILWKDLVATTRIPIQNWLQLLIPAAFPAIIGSLLGRENGFNVIGWTVLFTMQMPGIFC